jgi:hypothetical protein
VQSHPIRSEVLDAVLDVVHEAEEMVPTDTEG